MGLYFARTALLSMGLWGYNMIIIWPYKYFSSGAKLLAKELEVRRIGGKRKYNPKYYLIINWGNSSYNGFDFGGTNHVVNDPYKVNNAINKRTTFSLLNNLEGVTVPRFSEAPVEAEGWGTDVVVRHLLTASGGRGIELVPKGRPVPAAPLYVEYIKKKTEYRIHVFDGRIIDIAEKRKVAGRNDVNSKIRNHANGWVFCRGNINPPQEVKDSAILAVLGIGLTFGAVDIIWNEYYKKAYVLEVNTAPGIIGSTIGAYAKAIRAFDAEVFY